MKEISVLGIDLGASNFRIYSQKGKSSIRKKSPADFSDPERSILRRIREMVGEKNFDAIGVAVAGFVSSKECRIIRMPNAGVEDIAICDLLRREFRCQKITVMNDAVAAVYGEYSYQKVKEKDTLYLTFSTGLGGAAMLNDMVISGREGNSHEVGHIVIDSEGRVTCGCGGKGHWEAYCSGRGLVSFFRYFMKEMGEVRDEMPSTEDIFNFSRRGIKYYRQFLKEAIRMNSAGLASVINVYAPQLLIVGGPVALNNWDDYILPSFRLARKGVVLEMPELRRSELADYASAYGAAKLAAKSVE
ncbi:MAG: ROK family protein [Conexivisphaerales archaeon]